MNYGIWDKGLLSSVVCRSVFNPECVFGLIYSLKFKMTQNPKQGVKGDPGLTPLIFGAEPTKMTVQHYALALPIESIMVKHTYLYCWLKKDWPAIHLIFSPVRYSVLHHKDPIKDSQRQGALIIDAFPAHAAWLGLTATCKSGSAICNNVTSSSALQVCKDGFTNLVSNVMTKWYF